MFVDIHIGFKQDNMTVVGMLNEYINLEIKRFSGTLQSGLIISLILQLEGPQGIVYLSINFMSIIFKIGIAFNSSILKFGQNISSHTVNLNVSQLIIAFNVTSKTFNFTGRLIIQQASFIHIILNPVKVNVHYISNIVNQPTMSWQTFSAATVSPFTTTMNFQPFSSATVSAFTTTMNFRPFSSAAVSTFTTTMNFQPFSSATVSAFTTTMNFQPFSSAAVSAFTTTMNFQPFSSATVSAFTTTMNFRPFSAATVSPFTTTMNFQPFSAATVSPFTTTMNFQPFSATMTSSVTLAMSMQTFSAVTVTSVTNTLSTSNYSLLPVIIGVVGAIVIIAIIVIVIGFIGVYFYGMHKGKQMSVNSNCQEMTTLPNQPSILTEYEYLPVIASSSTEQRDGNEHQKISQIPLTMA